MHCFNPIPCVIILRWWSISCLYDWIFLNDVFCTMTPKPETKIMRYKPEWNVIIQNMLILKNIVKYETIETTAKQTTVKLTTGELSKLNGEFFCYTNWGCNCGVKLWCLNTKNGLFKWNYFKQWDMTCVKNWLGLSSKLVLNWMLLNNGMSSVLKL